MALKNEYMKRVFADCQKRNGNEPEFLQAVEEVLESLEPVVEADDIYEKNGIDVRYVNVDDRGMPVAELRASGADVVHLSPSHHFPTGVVMPIGRRQ